MRFPLHNKMKWGHLNIANASLGLEEALIERGIVNPEDGSNPGYFDLPIPEGPLLELLQKLYDLEPCFHIGCHLDERAPSFEFFVEDKPNPETSVYFHYERRLLLEIFKTKGFRKGFGSKQVRDLDALAVAYNDPTQYIEQLKVGVLKEVRTQQGGVVMVASGFHQRVQLEIRSQEIHLGGLSTLDPEEEPMVQGLGLLSIASECKGNYPRPYLTTRTLDEALSAMLEFAARIIPMKMPLTGDLIKPAAGKYPQPIRTELGVIY